MHVGSPESRAVVGGQPELSNSSEHLDREPLDLSIDVDEAVVHRDERQIGLDTNRSFVLYPVGDYNHFSTRIDLNKPNKPRRRSRKGALEAAATRAHRFCVPQAPPSQLLSSQSYARLCGTLRIIVLPGLSRHCLRLILDTATGGASTLC